MPATYDPVRAAFYVSWDPTSLAALQQHFRDIDLLIPERLHSITSTGRLDVEADPKLAAWEQTLLQQTPPIKIPTMPLLNNSDGTNWLTDEMAAMLKSPRPRATSGAASGSISHSKTTSPDWLLILKKFPIKARKISANSSPNLPPTCTAPT